MPSAGPPEWLAVVLVASIVALPLLCGLVALVAGVRALRAIRAAQGRLTGRLLAVTGILFGVGGLLLGGLVGAGVAYQWTGSPASVRSKSDQELQRLLAGPAPLRRQAAAQALAMRGPAARDLLIAVLRDSARPQPARLAALRGLQSRADVDWPALLPDLLRIMGGSEFELQSVVSQQLQWAGGIHNAQLLRALLDPDPAVRAGAVAAMRARVQSGVQWGGLPRLGGADLPLLIRTLEQSDDRAVKLVVVEWLAGMGTGAAPSVAALQVVAADTTDGDLSVAARAAIAVIGK